MKAQWKHYKTPHPISMKITTMEEAYLLTWGQVLNFAHSERKMLLAAPGRMMIHFTLRWDCAYKAQLSQLVKVKCI